MVYRNILQLKELFKWCKTQATIYVSEVRNNMDKGLSVDSMRHDSSKLKWELFSEVVMGERLLYYYSKTETHSSLI